jgi:hypothetical protein
MLLRMKALPAVILVFPVMAACDSEDAGVSPVDGSFDIGDAVSDVLLPRICDGSEGVRFRAFIEPRTDREFRGSIVRVENGHPSFMVDAKCNYWMGGGWIEDAMSRDMGWRTGHLDATAEQSLSAMLQSTVDDCRIDPTLFDAAVRVISSETTTIRCGGSGRAFDSAWMLVEELARRNWPGARELDGPLRIEAVEADPTTAPPFISYEWPLTESLSDYIVMSSDGRAEFATGMSKLISNPESYAKLRVVRAQYLADRRRNPTSFVNDAMKVTNSGQAAFVYLRDALPHEDLKGLVPLPERRN